jgi:hypothetical protein
MLSPFGRGPGAAPSLLQDTHHVFFFQNKSLYSGFFINPVFLGCPRLFDYFYFIGLAEQKKNRFLFHADFKAAVINAGLVEFGQLGMRLDVLVDIFRLGLLDKRRREETLHAQKAQTQQQYELRNDSCHFQNPPLSGIF